MHCTTVIVILAQLISVCRRRRPSWLPTDAITAAGAAATGAAATATIVTTNWLLLLLLLLQLLLLLPLLLLDIKSKIVFSLFIAVVAHIPGLLDTFHSMTSNVVFFGYSKLWPTPYANRLSVIPNTM